MTEKPKVDPLPEGKAWSWSEPGLLAKVAFRATLEEQNRVEIAAARANVRPSVMSRHVFQLGLAALEAQQQAALGDQEAA